MRFPYKLHYNQNTTTDVTKRKLSKMILLVLCRIRLFHFQQIVIIRHNIVRFHHLFTHNKFPVVHHISLDNNIVSTNCFVTISNTTFKSS